MGSPDVDARSWLAGPIADGSAIAVLSSPMEARGYRQRWLDEIDDFISGIHRRRHLYRRTCGGRIDREDELEFADEERGCLRAKELIEQMPLAPGEHVAVLRARALTVLRERGPSHPGRGGPSTGILWACSVVIGNVHHHHGFWRELLLPDESAASEHELGSGTPGVHVLPASIQSPTRSDPVDPSEWSKCPHCARGHASVVCPFCGFIRGDGPHAMRCVQTNGPCKSCRSCFECRVEFEGTRCPGCGFPRGYSWVMCPSCRSMQAVFMPHWGDTCDLFTLDCARCLSQFPSFCIC